MFSHRWTTREITGKKDSLLISFWSLKEVIAVNFYHLLSFTFFSVANTFLNPFLTFFILLSIFGSYSRYLYFQFHFFCLFFLFSLCFPPLMIQFTVPRVILLSLSCFSSLELVILFLLFVSLKILVLCLLFLTVIMFLFFLIPFLLSLLYLPLFLHLHLFNVLLLFIILYQSVRNFWDPKKKMLPSLFRWVLQLERRRRRGNREKRLKRRGKT